MSIERLIGVLASLGLTKREAQVYVYLSKRGPCEEKNLEDALKLTKHKLSQILKRLSTLEMVNASSEYSIKYCATPLERVLDMLLKEKRQQAKVLQINREELILNWQRIFGENSEG